MSEVRQVFIIGDGGFAREVAAWAEDAAFEVLGLVGPDFQQELIERADRDRLRLSVILGLGKPSAKQAAVEALGPRFSYPSLIHPKAVAGPRSTAKDGLILCPGSVITTDVACGRFVTLNLNCTVGHDVVLEDFCSLMPGVAVSGHCRIGRGAYLGAGSTVLERVEMGQETILGAGAVLTKPLPPGETWVGVPAKRIQR